MEIHKFRLSLITLELFQEFLIENNMKSNTIVIIILVAMIMGCSTRTGYNPPDQPGPGQGLIELSDGRTLSYFEYGPDNGIHHFTGHQHHGCRKATVHHHEEDDRKHQGRAD